MHRTTVALIVILALGLLSAPSPSDAQRPAKVPRIGHLRPISLTAETTHYLEAFRQGLHEFGWVEGQNIIIEYRYAEGNVERLPDLAAELDV